MPMITIHHADGRFKVLKNGEQIRVPMSTGETPPVEFETREAAGVCEGLQDHHERAGTITSVSTEASLSRPESEHPAGCIPHTNQP